MYDNIANGWMVFTQSLEVLGRYPKFLVPIIGWWVLYAPMIIYAQFFFPWSRYQFWAGILFVFLVVFIWSAALGVACLVLLEMIRNTQEGRPVEVGSAFRKVINEDFARALPITFVWAIIHVLLSMIQALMRSDDVSQKDGTLSPQNAAEALAGYIPHFGLSDLFFESSKDALRMIVFLILPGVAWEGLWPMEAIKKGLHILKAHLSIFATGFVLTEMAGITVFIPISILIVFAQWKYPISNYTWCAAILYSGLALSFVFFLQQMFAAQLYLWHLKWLKAAESAKASGQPLPKLKDIPEPVIFHDVPEFLALKEFFDL